jgi:hypothetical protein
MSSDALFTPSKEGGKNVIEISNTMLNDPNVTQRYIQNKITEELLHHVTQQFTEKYINFDKIAPIDTNGKLNFTFKEGVEIPSAMRTMMIVYQQAVNEIIKEQGLSTVIQNINNIQMMKIDKSDSSLNITNDNLMNTYRITNLNEYLAGIFLKDGNFAKKMAKTKYLNSDKSILDKFMDKVLELMQTILPKGRRDSISVATLDSLYKLLVGEQVMQEEKIQPLEKQSFNSQENMEVLQDAITLSESLKSDDTNTEPLKEITEIENTNNQVNNPVNNEETSNNDTSNLIDILNEKGINMADFAKLSKEEQDKLLNC